jgi:hypothetical protein
MIPSSVTSSASTMKRRWSAGLLIAVGAGWLVIGLLDVPTHLGWYGLGATPTGVQCTLAALVAVSVTIGTATRTVTAPRPLLAMLVVIVWLRVAGRAVPLLGHDDRGLDTSASLISTGILGATVAVTVVMIVVAAVARRTINTAAVLVVVALVATTVHGLGVPTGVREVTAGIVAAAFTMSGVVVLRRRRAAGPP